MPSCNSAPPPTNGLLPKDVTRVSDLIRATGADGTGVVVAVLDTGVDPGASGLLETTTGQRKVIDVVDCTGSGDVETTTVAHASSDCALSALSGRTLHLPEAVCSLNPSGNYRLGIKHGYELFPGSLVSRLRKERRAKWDKKHRAALNAVRLHLCALRDAPDASTAEVEEYEARQAVLLSAEKNYRDVGPIYDCVLFDDGANWRVIVDTSEKGTLSECDVLEDYRLRCRYGEFGNGVMMHFAVNVHENGDVLSIVVDGGSHGTHVAGILAANFPDTPHLNGLAPGAQIVSLKIGDSRLSSMETHQGTIRALSYLLQHSTSGNEETEEKEEHGFRTDQGTMAPHSASADNKSPIPAVASEGSIPLRPETPIGSKAVAGQNDASSLEPNIANVSRSPRSGRLKSSLRIDVANMSFGEHSRDVNKGRFVDLVNKLVYKHNVVFLSSAGNDGPALSSVSAPGGTTEALIGVGAYHTPAMLTQAYSLLDSEFGIDHSEAGPASGSSPGDGRGSVEGVPVSANQKSRVTSSANNEHEEPEAVAGIPYTWSSRGPVTDGAMGVSICAPGGAIAPVPVWTVRKKMLMNGTSMSSPSAAGAVAVVVSFLKNEGIPYSSALVRRAIENTARRLKPPRLGSQLGEKSRAHALGLSPQQRDMFDSEYYRDLVFAVGNGSIDAKAACEYLQQYAGRGKELRRCQIAVLSASENAQSAIPSGGRAQWEFSDTTENGPTGRNVDMAEETDTREENVRLEEWQIRVRVEDGSLARRGSSSPGCGSLNTTRGIYLRGESDTAAVHRAVVAVEALARKEECPKTKKALAGLEVQLSLQCAASWVEVPSMLVLLGGGRSFPVFVDPVGLESGRAHFAEIIGSVLVDGKIGAASRVLFRVPVAVHKPESLVDGVMIKPLREVCFAPGSVVRRFYEAPLGATFGLLKITAGSGTAAQQASERPNITETLGSVEMSDVSSRHATPSEDLELTPLKIKSFASAPPDDTMLQTVSKSGEGCSSDEVQREHKPLLYSGTRRTTWISGSADARNFEAHIVQVSPQKHCGELETRQYFTIRPGAQKEFIVRVQGGSTLELCLAQIWSSPGNSLLERVDLVFGGVIPQPSALHAAAGATCFPRVEVGSLMPTISNSLHYPQPISGYAPRGTLSHLQRAVAAQKTKIRMLGERDSLPEIGAISQLQLEYSFEVYDSSSTIRLLFPGLNRSVYESEIEGGPYVIVYDQNKQFMAASDIYPSEMNLNKGEYFALAYIRHDDLDILERLQELRMTVEYEIGDVHVDAYDSAHAASLGMDERRASRNTAALESKERRAFYFSMPKRSVFPKWATHGDTAVGKMSVDKVLSPLGNSMRRGSEIPSYSLSVSIGPSPPSSSKSDSSSKSGSQDRDKRKNGESGKPKERETATEKATDKVEGGKASNETGDGKKSEPGEAIEADPDQWFEEAVRKLKLKKLRSLLKDRKFDDFDKLHKGMNEKYPEDNEIALLNIDRLDIEFCREIRKTGRSEVLRKLATKLLAETNSVIERLDAVAIATHFGMMIDSDSSEETNRRRKFETKRAQLTEAMFRKTRLLFLWMSAECEKVENRKVLPGDKEPEGREEDPEKLDGSGVCKLFEEAWKELGRWVALDGKGSLPGSGGQTVSDGSMTNEDLLMLVARREVHKDRLGSALKLFDGYYGAPPSKKVESVEMIEFREELYSKLGWYHLEERERCSRVMRFPVHRALY